MSTLSPSVDTRQLCSSRVLVDPSDLLDAVAVAALLGLSSYRSVSTYRRRYDTFPAPVIATGKCLLWLRSDVEAWAASRSSPAV
jgi:predicted DNA-binding transcriptional regulator AlpA